MAGSQRQHISFAQRFGYGLGRAVKRLGASWAGFERRLLQRAGERAPVVKVGLLLMKVVLGAAGIAAVLFAAFWLAAFFIGVFALVTFGGSGRDPIFDDGFNTAWDPWNFWKS